MKIIPQFKLRVDFSLRRFSRPTQRRWRGGYLNPGKPYAGSRPVPVLPRQPWADFQIPALLRDPDGNGHRPGTALFGMEYMPPAHHDNPGQLQKFSPRLDSCKAVLTGHSGSKPAIFEAGQCLRLVLPKRKTKSLGVQPTLFPKITIASGNFFPRIRQGAQIDMGPTMPAKDNRPAFLHGTYFRPR